ncbi:MAG TPA: lipoyl(octanoyl) transferase LipB [Bacteroidales bacterium]|nr:lipoyl(octanoyl) transferase LipB [Bacteroidales bacterium]
MSYKVEYKDLGLKDYKETWDYQASVFNKIVEEKTREVPRSVPGMMIFVEHPHVYTLGRSGSVNNLLIDSVQLKRKDASFYHIDRGGDITYHGPGQIVGYPIFDIEVIGISLKEYIHRLEEAIIRTVGEYGIEASRLPGSTGAWLEPGTAGKARKICAIGVKASRYVTMHGFAFNVNTDLSYFDSINPCGFRDKGVTSLERELGSKQDFTAAKEKVRKNLKNIFDLDWI